MSLLAVRDARKSFGALVALEGVSIELREGELIGLVGPNGAGKTTLVRAIAGRVRLDAGAVELLNRPVEPGSPRPELGVVPQEIALYASLTARENLEAFGRLHGLAARALAARVDWALEWTGLAARDREPVRRFSGGMRRRLNIACGVLHEPRVLLLDEPTVGVDPQSRERIYEMLAALRRAGTSLLLTTHQLDEAESLCDRIVVIDHGRVIASGRLAELIAGTIGEGRRVLLSVDRPVAEPIDGLEPEDGSGTTLGAHVKDVASELPALLRHAAAAGLEVRDVAVRSPSLHAVFIHLTGRELRE
ncbi:MAG TPA: ABC transporter ATP-binding protein [Vicinamibacteria bacterium]